MGRIKLLSELIKAVGKKNKKTLKNTKPTTIKGVNIKTKAGKEFGEKVKNQPRRIRGQKPEGMRDDLPADIDKPSFLKKRSIASSFRDKALADRKRDIKSKILMERATYKPTERTKAINEAFAKAVNEKDAKKARKMLEDIKKMNKGGGLREIPEGNKGLPKLPKEVRNKMGFMKDGGAPKPGSKVSVKEIDKMMFDLKKGTELMKFLYPAEHKKNMKKILKKKDGGLVNATAKLKAQGLTHGGPVRGKARGMGAAKKGGGYNV